MSDAVVGRIVGVLDVDGAKFSSGIQKAKGEFTSFHGDMTAKGKSLTGVIGGIGAAMVAVGAVKFLGDAVRAAIEDQVELVKLKTAVEATGSAWSAYADRMDEAGRAGIQLGFADDLTTAALAKLTTMTGSAETALRDISLAQDLARATGMGLTEAAGLVAKVEEGRIGIAARQLPFLNAQMSAEEALGQLREHTAGQAAAYAETAAGASDRWNASVALLQRTIGEKLLPSLTKMVDVGTSVITAFSNLDPTLQGTIVGVGVLGVTALVVVPKVVALWAQLAQLGVVSASTAAEEGVATAATATLGETAAATSGSINAASIATGAYGVAAAAAIGLAIGALINMIPAVKEFQDSLGSAMGEAETWQDSLRTANDKKPWWAFVGPGSAVYGAMTLGGALGVAAGSANKVSGAVAESGASARTATAATIALADATAGYTDTLIYEANNLSVVQTAEQRALTDKIAVKRAYDALKDAVKKYGKNSDEAKLAQINLTAAQNRSKDSAKVAADAAQTAGAAARTAAAAYERLTDAVSRANAAMKQGRTGTGTKIPGTQLLPGAAGGVITPQGGGVPMVVAENGYRETLLNWSPANYNANLSMIGETLRGIGAVSDAPASAPAAGSAVESGGGGGHTFIFNGYSAHDRSVIQSAVLDTLAGMARRGRTLAVGGG